MEENTENNSISHVIFDMDGLLLDTESLYTVAYEEFCQRYNKKYTVELKRRLMGRKTEHSLGIMIEELELPCSVDYIIKEMAKIYKEIFPSSTTMPGVERLINHLLNHNIPICVATSSTRNNFQLKTNSHKELFDKFNHIIVGDDPRLKEGKPHPDIFLLAADGFSSSSSTPVVDRSRCLVFEDAENGVLAAEAAGMRCVWVVDRRFFPDVSAEHSYATVLESLAEFRPEKFGLPPFED